MQLSFKNCLFIALAIGAVCCTFFLKQSPQDDSLVELESVTGELFPEMVEQRYQPEPAPYNWERQYQPVPKPQNNFVDRAEDNSVTLVGEAIPETSELVTASLDGDNGVTSLLDSPVALDGGDELYTDHAEIEPEPEPTDEIESRRQLPANIVTNSFVDQAEPLSTNDSEMYRHALTQVPPAHFPTNQLQSSQAPPNRMRPQEQRVNRGIAPIQMRLTERTAIQAVQRIEYGKTLARRGATFAANEEFIAALRIIAEDHDRQTGGNEFSRALSMASMALREAEDFMPRNSEIPFDVARIVDGHQTRVLTLEEASSTTASQALAEYLEFAEEHMDMAGGRNVVSAEALYSLGKLFRLRSETNKVPGNPDLLRSIVYHRAALVSDPSHHRSANELGVLMARNGQLGQAKELLKLSLIREKSPLAWQNLAKVHSRLGEQQYASLASNESRLAINTQVPNDNTSTIRWMPNQQFNRTGAMEFDSQVAVADRTATQAVPPRAPEPVENGNEAASPEEDSSTRQAKLKSFTNRLKSLF